MKVGILKYPGGHGDTELMHVLGKHFGLNVRELWYKESGPFNLDLLFIGGGFPCHERGDRLCCLNSSPALQYLPEFAAKGKYIVAFGNGFQLLCEAGLLPGRLEMNVSKKFICKQVYIKPENHSNVFTGLLNADTILRVPIATNFGRFVADDTTLMQMRQAGQILFRYCDYEGRITEAVNYTGSVDNIAMVCNEGKNVFGMIPQPERAVTTFRNDADGKEILASFLTGI